MRFLFVLIVLLLTSCNDSGGPPPALPASQWAITYSSGTPPALVPQGDGSYTTPVPAAPGHINYVTEPAPPLGATITMTFAIVGTGTVIPVPGADEPPAQIRLYMQRAGDTMSGQGEYEFYRWWS